MKLDRLSSGDLRPTFYFFSVFGAVGILSILLSVSSRIDAGTALLWAFACLLSGALIGFLFGIPKILQGDNQNARGEGGRGYRQQVNTNLEQISDWLTKIIVGLGLIQLTKIPRYLGIVADLLSASLHTNGSKAFALGVIVYFTILGFLFGYVATRLFLAGAFSRADRAATEAIMELKAIAERLSPELFTRIVLQTKPEELIQGEHVSAQSGDDEAQTGKDKESFAQAYERLINL